MCPPPPPLSSFFSFFSLLTFYGLFPLAGFFGFFAPPPPPPTHTHTHTHTHTLNQGLTLYELMEAAGAATYNAMRDHYPDARRVVVAAGAGLNAGDGLIVARLARADGLQVQVLCAKPDKLKGDAEIALGKFTDIGGTVDLMDLKAFASADVIVDALLGTGISTPVRPDMQVNQEKIIK